MTINRGSRTRGERQLERITRRTRGESRLERITKRVGRILAIDGIFTAYGKKRDLHLPQEVLENSLAAFEEHEREAIGTLHLKTGELVEVKLGDLKDYLKENRDKIALQHDPDMPPRRRSSKQVHNQ